MPLPEPTWIQVTMPKHNDRAAFVAATPSGTGATLRTRVVGQRHGERTENLGMTRAMADALIRQLGGTPPS